MNLSEQDKAFIKILQRGFTLERRPYLRIARTLDMTEEGVINKLARWLESGIIRRIGAAVRPHKLGNQVNALVIWNVPPDKIEEVGKFAAEFKEISHCYERECPPGWQGNLYTMIHARDEEHFENILNTLQTRFGLERPSVYRTLRELKKSSMRYFEEDKQ